MTPYQHIKEILKKNIAPAGTQLSIRIPCGDPNGFSIRVQNGLVKTAHDKLKLAALEAEFKTMEAADGPWHSWLLKTPYLYEPCQGQTQKNPPSNQNEVTFQLSAKKVERVSLKVLFPRDEKYLSYTMAGAKLMVSGKDFEKLCTILPRLQGPFCVWDTNSNQNKQMLIKAPAEGPYVLWLDRLNRSMATTLRGKGLTQREMATSCKRVMHWTKDDITQIKEFYQT